MGNFYQSSFKVNTEYVDFIENENLKMKVEINRLRRELNIKPADFRPILLKSGIVVSTFIPHE